MQISAHLNFFSISDCGLYKHGTSASYGLSPEEVFKLIFDWTKGKMMEETIPWDPSTSRINLPKCYCHDQYSFEDEYLFVLWKSDTDGSGTIWGAQATAATGEGKVVEQTSNFKGGQMIWGRPCYYWILPKINTIISIKTDHSLCDSALFQEWVTKCITNKIKFKEKIKTTTDTGKIKFEIANQAGLSLNFRFDVKLKTISTQSSQIQELAKKVTHIIRRDTIAINGGADERSGWVRLFDTIPLVTAPSTSKRRQIEVKAEIKPSAEEIQKIIKDFAKENRKKSKWNNVGFGTQGGIVWVDKFRLHETLEIYKENSRSVIFAAAELHEKLHKNRDHLLREIAQENGITTPFGLFGSIS